MAGGRAVDKRPLCPTLCIVTCLFLSPFIAEQSKTTPLDPPGSPGRSAPNYTACGLPSLWARPPLWVLAPLLFSHLLTAAHWETVKRGLGLVGSGCGVGLGRPSGGARCRGSEQRTLGLTVCRRRTTRWLTNEDELDKYGHVGLVLLSFGLCCRRRVL